MKQITLLLLLTMSLFACKKEKNKQEDPFKDYPEATCADTTDDGKFEVWNDAVKNMECADCIYSDSELNGYQFAYWIDSKKYSKSSKNAVNFYFSPTTDLTVSLHLVQKGIIQSNNYSVSTISSVKKINLNQYDMSIFQPGCARLYYYVTPGGSKTVITKGHYDIEITQ